MSVTMSQSLPLNNVRHLVLNNIVSPYGLAMMSYTLFLLSCMIPPSAYWRYMAEPDLMFLDPLTIWFYTSCVATFVAGVWFIGRLLPSVSFAERSYTIAQPSALFLLPPLVACLVFSMLSSVLLLKSNPLIIPLLLAQQASELGGNGSVGLDTSGSMSYSVSFLTGIIWWALWRYYQLGVRAKGRRIVKVMLVVALLAAFVSSSLLVSRHALIVAITGLAILHVLRKMFLRQLSVKLIAKIGLILLIGGGLFFFLVSLLKGNVDWEGQIDTLVGYTAASYNRLAALLHGELHYEYPGRGIYFSSFLSFNHAFNRMLPYGRIMGIPAFFDWWGSAFSSVGRAGLNPNLIFCGTFGEIYLETGWLAPVFMFGYGLLYGLIWFWMKEGRMVGVLLYPYFAYCIIFWFTGNGLFDQDIVAIFIDAVILSAYEFLIRNRGDSPLAVSYSG